MLDREQVASVLSEQERRIALAKETTNSLAPWVEPWPMHDLDLAFPARGMDYAPTAEHCSSALEELPVMEKEKYLQFANYFFFGRPPIQQVMLREGIDGDMAFRHLMVVAGCYAFKHEHKLEALAVLAGMWFGPDIEYGKDEVL